MAATVIPDYINENSERRGQTNVSGPWGTGTSYVRECMCPKGKVDDIMAGTGIFILGTLAPAAWIEDGVADDAKGPRVQSVQREPGDGTDRLIVQYLRINGGAVASAYAETSRVRRPDSQHERVTETYGVATAMASTGIPAVGDHLDGGTAIPTTAVCRGVTLDDTTFPGRVLVRCEWAALKARTLGF